MARRHAEGEVADDVFTDNTAGLARGHTGLTQQEQDGVSTGSHGVNTAGTGRG